MVVSSALTQTSATPLRVVVPAFFPEYVAWPGLPWDRLDQAAAMYPGRIIAITNVFNGAGLMFNPVYEYTFRTFRNSGGSIIGYVYSNYGARPIAEVKSEIDKWFTWYDVDGIFIDEMDTVAGGHEAYYAEIYDYVQARLATALVLGNAGKPTSPSYLVQSGGTATSALCIHEDDKGELRWRSDSWVYNHDRSHFGAMLYDTPDYKWRPAIDHAWSQNVGLLYVTNDQWPNPWDTLPAYFEDMLYYIDMVY